ncbi:hypothetical protein [Actinophytocola sp.]|uniref:hypothetical protein n=1 Tax=Actinophytocola sp. TaxID=1872138 RepID=UPI00389AD131
MTDARTAHSVLPLAAGVVLVVGGAPLVGAADDLALTIHELYDLSHDRRLPTGGPPRGHRRTPPAQTPVPRWCHQ